MPRTPRLTDALRGRGKALVFLGAAAGLAGAGTASAAALASPAPAAYASPLASAATGSPVAQFAASHAGPADHLAGIANQASARAALGQASTPAAQSASVATATPTEHPTPAAHTAPAAHTTPAAHAASAVHATAARTAPAQRPHEYKIYDSVTPSSIPSGHEIATYADGGYAVSPSQVSGRDVLWIDTRGTDPKASALDVEPGDATPSVAATWAWRKLHSAANSVAIIYTMRSEWPAVQAAVHHLPEQMQSRVRWWIADPTGVAHVVPGASATQWYWGSNYDITTAKPGF